MASEATIALAKAAIRLPFIGEEFDVEALAAAAKKCMAEKGSMDVNADDLQKVFIELGVETEVLPPEPEVPEGKGEEEEEEEEEEVRSATAGSGEEGEEEKEPEPEAPKEYTRHSAALFALFDPDATGTISLPRMVASLSLFKAGYGEDALRFALGAWDVQGAGAADEAGLWAALQLCTVAPLTAQQLAQVRRAWRNADKFGASEEEEEEEEGDGDEGEGEGEGKEGGGEGEGPVETRVMIESWMEAVAADEYLAGVLLAAVPIPLEDPETSDAPEDEDDE